MGYKPSNSAGNTGRDIRRFCRENGIPPTMDNVERIGREVRRTEAENERVERIARETGRGGTYDEHGDVHARVRGDVARDMERRRREQERRERR